MTIVIPWYILAIVAWLIMGFCASFLFYADYRQYSYMANKGWCPTPASIIGFVIGSFGGPLLFLVAAIVVVTRDITTDKWWSTPVCKKNLTNDD